MRALEARHKGCCGWVRCQAVATVKGRLLPGSAAMLASGPLSCCLRHVAVTPVRLRLSEESRDAARGVFRFCAPFFHLRGWVRLSRTQCCVRPRVQRCVLRVFRVQPLSRQAFAKKPVFRHHASESGCCVCGVLRGGRVTGLGVARVLSAFVRS
jgi:hypothetical protein